MKFYYSGTVVLCVAALGTQPAFAQGSPDQPSQAITLGSPDDIPEAAKPQQESGNIADIVVTANRRSETVQRSSLAIEVIGAEALRGVSQASDLSAITPGVQIANAGNITQAYIRGVGSFVATGRQENAVAFSIDGVYLQTGTMISPAMFDLERVEVLKGPQGTLYGRNATAGAINLISASPKFDEIGGYVGAEGGNYDLRRFNGALNIPINDTLAVRAAFQKSDRDGYFTDGTNDEDSLVGRLKLLWQPSPAVRIGLTLEAGDMGGRGASTARLPVIDGNPWIGALDPRRLPFITPPLPLIQPSYDNTLYSATLQVDIDLPFATLTAIPAYRHEHYDQLTYGPGYRFTEDTKTVQKSLEVRLGNQTPELKWVIGGYVLDVDQALDYEVANAALLQANKIFIPGQATKTYAFFGELTYSLSDRLRAIAGLRYSNEKNRGDGTNNAAAYRGNSPAYLPGVESGDFPFSASVKASALTYRTGLEFDVTQSSMLFATVSRGFKGGGWFPDRAGALDTFKPEKLDAFELGSRNRFLDNRLQLNLEGFYWKYHDQQQAYVGVTSLGIPALITTNAGSSTIYGANVDLVWRLSDHDTFRGSVEYLHARYDTFLRNTPAPALAGSLCSTRPASSGFTIDCSGVRLQRAPRFTGSAGYEHIFEINGGAKIVAGADMTFGTGRYLTLDFNPQSFDKGYALFNADLAYFAPQDRWSITTYIQNIGKTAFATGGGINVGNLNATINAPRTYGVRARYNF
ncbi:MAG: TonB-dependent receptor [Rhizobium sp.]|nr:MAG: TonB-dependent receptor [Rhizobium sp.]